MKIAVIGGTGMVGSRVVSEAVRRGHEVTAISRKGTAADGARAFAGDVNDSGLVASLADENDVVVSAIGPSREPGGDPSAFPAAITRLAGDVGATRLIVVGGAGSLFVAPGVRLVDTPEFPVEYKAEALAAADALEALRDTSADWTFFSPAPVIAPGERSGKYVLGIDSPVGDSISAEDYAVALLDEIEQPQHRKARFTAAN